MFIKFDDIYAAAQPASSNSRSKGLIKYQSQECL